VREFGLDVADYQREPFENFTRAQTLLALIEALSELDAPGAEQWHLVYVSSALLFEEFGYERTNDRIERILTRSDVGEPLASWLRLERARNLNSRQRLAESLRDLERARAAILDAPDVVEWSKSERAGAAPEDHAVRESLRIAATWYVVRAGLDISLGRLWSVDEPLERAAWLAERADSAVTQLEVLDHRLRLTLAHELPEEVEPLCEAAQASGLLARFHPRDLEFLRLYRTVARLELARRAGQRDEAALFELRGLRDAPEFPDSLRKPVASYVAAYAAEWGRPAEAREALLYAAGAADVLALPPHDDPLHAANLAALALRIVLSSTESSERAVGLEQLERFADGFLEQCARFSKLSSAVATLQFIERERVLGELIRGCVAVHGEGAGSKRALNWLYRAQCVGGLSRGLGLERAKADFERDLATLVAPQRGLVVFHSARDASFVFLVDVHGVQAHEIADGSRLRKVASALANEATRAVRRGPELGDPAVRELVEQMARFIDAPKLLRWLERQREVTVVGDESVGHLPLALLATSDAARLGDRVALGYAPTIPVGAELARRAQARGPIAAKDFDVLLLGAPPPPADVKIERGRFEQWSERLNGRAKLVVGSEATPEAFAEGARGCELVQIVAHGQYDVRRETRAGFLLHSEAPGGGTVWADAVERTPAARVTALAVCRASQRPVVFGDDGRTGLAASFLLAGSDLVVQTPIDLEVDEAMELFERFSLRIAAGDSPANALLAARGSVARPDASPLLQDYLVHVLGAVHAPLVDAASAAEFDSQSETSQGPRASLARWWIAALAAGAVLLAALWRRAQHAKSNSH
jgi:hypothetical protein